MLAVFGGILMNYLRLCMALGVICGAGALMVRILRVERPSNLICTSEVQPPRRRAAWGWSYLLGLR